jgi:hypothetical protein
MRRRPLLVAVAMLAAAGCGSTVQLSPTQAAAGQPVPSSDGLGLSVPSTVPQPIASGPSSTRPSAEAVSPGVVAPTKAVSRRPSSEKPAATPTASADHTPIRIGVLYGQDVGAAAAAVGISGLSTGDTYAQSQAMVRWVNANGGMGGHPIQLSGYAIKATGGGDVESNYQAACTALTQDQHVRYVVTILSLPPSSLPCFAKAGVGVFDDESGVSGEQMARYSDYFAGPADYSIGRSTADLVDDLVRRGWLTSKSKIGAFTYDDPPHKAAVSGALVHALNAHGLRLTSAAAVPNSTAYFTQSGAVVLKFRSAGVDRVIPVGTSPLALMLSASTQGYRPAYAVTSAYGPGALLEGTAPKDQLVNSVGIGWQPFLDIGRGKHPGPVSRNESLCFKLMKQAGQASTSATTRGFEAQICDLFFYLREIGNALPTLPSNLIAAARPVIGDSFRSAATFSSDTRRHPDGVAAYRDLAYQQSCSCYQYVSPIRRTTS